MPVGKYLNPGEYFLIHYCNHKYYNYYIIEESFLVHIIIICCLFPCYNYKLVYLTCECNVQFCRHITCYVFIFKSMCTVNVVMKNYRFHSHTQPSIRYALLHVALRTARTICENRMAKE